MRDAPFDESTRKAIAQKAGYICSRPGCGQVTIGPSRDGRGIVLNGHACHIYPAADSPKGPRHKPEVPAEFRMNEANGVWMCPTHSSLVDKDWSNYSDEELFQWKRARESEQRDRLHGLGAADLAGCWGLLERVERLRENFDSPDFARGISELHELGTCAIGSGAVAIDAAAAKARDCLVGLGAGVDGLDERLAELSDLLRTIIRDGAGALQLSLEQRPSIEMRVGLAFAQLNPSIHGKLSVVMHNKADAVLERYSIEIDIPVLWRGVLGFTIADTMHHLESGQVVTKAKFSSPGPLYSQQRQSLTMTGHWFPIEATRNAQFLDMKHSTVVEARVFADGLKKPLELTFSQAEVLRWIN